MSDSIARVTAELGRISTFFPILPGLGNRWAATRPWEGMTVGLHLHLTTLTAALVQELTLGGGRWILSAANPATTDAGVVAFLRGNGLEVHSGGGVEDGIQSTLRAHPDLVADVGFQIGAAAMESGVHPRGAVEITRTGVTRMRARAPLPFPVMNINDGRLKPAVENRHGVGEGLWQAFTSLTGQHLAGRRVAVVGYGPVGAGVAAYARAGGAVVEVIDRDPVRRLVAHYDGFLTPEPGQLRRAQVIVTATGRKHSVSLDAMRGLRDGAVLLNAGHGADEIDVAGLRADADAIDNVGTRVVRYRLGDRHVVVLADGNPLNIVLNAGSQEPVILHFAVLGLALEWLARNGAPAGELALPDAIEEEAARAALVALG